MDKSGIPFAKLRAAFAVYNRTTNKSPQTVQWYEERLELFERFLGRRAVLAGVSVENVRAFIADLQGRTQRHANNPYVKNKEGVLSSSYIQGFARALRAFSSWLYEDGYTDTNVLRVVKPPKIQQKVVEVLKDEEVGQLLAVFDRTQTLGARDYAIVFTLLDCGLRASELCELTLDDAHIDEGYLKVLGKGNKQRLVPIGRACQDALFRWRERYRPLLEDRPSAYLFLSREGKPLTVDSLEELIDRAAKKAGIPRLHCHLLRHTFATNYLVKEVGDPLRLQQILGHTSLEMVRRYVALASVERSLLDRRASPMDLILKSTHLRQPVGLRPQEQIHRKRPPLQLVPR